MKTSFETKVLYHSAMLGDKGGDGSGESATDTKTSSIPNDVDTAAAAGQTSSG